MGFGADFSAKSKNHTTYNLPRKWHRNSTKKTRSQRYDSLKGMDPKVLRNMYFSKKHNKRLKKMQANNAKAIKALGIKALVKPKEVKTKVPKGSSCKLCRLVSPSSWLHHQGSQALQVKIQAKSQTKPQAAAVDAKAPAQGPYEAQASRKAPQ
ncbi:60S ribosomal protein L29-like [Pteronotus mesoamericanus]|uniref:60S ribosomal protein L29-like n=1 Tax=Pteronotus mesoamericanus TaxID=1884717 RepID=UPI0023EAD22C|nr:60S ribosomal protein L29-like [Pteronotus parnellii mesoamericanus]